MINMISFEGCYDTGIKVIQDFLLRAKSKALVIFIYSGHAAATDGVLYLSEQGEIHECQSG
ncbi:hypothetical protein MGU_06928 [Metarhizium guizhouense ARSEF 977]|uniref:Uncharacterized protein n=1 Tax=Metarhizium guizhouense (strain ARSEF 977) TaxID=1276136 RepID=A0A0B4I0Q4_METGA|nr:hypothetical protein MGU_06928 [Metarhizium guizhouense ARSEF 977]